MKPMTPVTLALMALITLTSAGCAPTMTSRSTAPEPTKPGVNSTYHRNSYLINASYDAVDRTLSAIETSRLSFQLNKERPLIVTSFVDIDDVRYSSTFGRMIGEQVGSRFAQSGYKVVEPKMRSNIFIPNPDRGPSSGEFMLSRELVNLSFEHDAQAVVVGTYAAAKDIIYVTLKVIDARDNMILYSMDYSLPLDDNTKKLLRDEQRRRLKL